MKGGDKEREKKQDIDTKKLTFSEETFYIMLKLSWYIVKG